MNKKIHLLLGVFLFGMQVCAVNQVDRIKTSVTTIQARLGASPYTIRLIDLRPHIIALFNEKAVAPACQRNFARGVYSEITEDGQTHVFNLDVRSCRDGEKFRLNTVVANPALALYDARPVGAGDEFAGLSLLFEQIDLYTRVRVTEYDSRVQKTLDAMQTINDRKNWYLRLEKVPATEYKSSLTGRITRVDGYVQPRMGQHKRATLFDMFSLQVDHYLQYGIGETIMHDDKRHPELGQELHFQISLFGILSGIDGDGNAYEQPGFFQYTFNIEGVCYHRAFKPWTVYHLRSVSNSKTQSIVRLAALSYLNGIKSGPTKDSLLQTLLKACWSSNDHKNWMFDDAIISDRCVALGQQIRENRNLSKKLKLVGS